MEKQNPELFAGVLHKTEVACHLRTILRTGLLNPMR